MQNQQLQIDPDSAQVLGTDEYGKSSLCGRLILQLSVYQYQGSPTKTSRSDF